MRRRPPARNRASLLCGLVVLLGLTAGSGGAQEAGGLHRPATATPLGAAIPPEVLIHARDWPVAQGNLAATRAAARSSLTAANVATLQLAWRFRIEAGGGYGGMTATPLIAGDTVFVQDMQSNVFALDRTTGRVRWERRYDVPSIGPNGLALAYGRVYGATGDTAEVFALDAATGAERWRVRLSNNPAEGIAMAPAVYDSTVYVSTVAGNTRGFNIGGSKGILYALDAATGATLWQFDTTTDNLWGNPRINSGGGLWYPPSFDEVGNLYFGVANAAPWPGTPDYPNGSSRPGPNDYASSIVSLDPATGAVRWHHNAAPHNLFDHDFQNTPVLLTVVVDGTATELAVGSGKTGTVLALKRASGEIAWRTEVGLHYNDDLSELPDQEPVAVAPGAWGGVISPIAYEGGRLYVPVVDMPTRFVSTGFDHQSMFDFARGRGQLVALDAADGSLLWTASLPTPAFAGVTVANDVVFTGGLDGVLRAFDVATGRLIWTYEAGAGLNAPPAIAGDLLVVAAAGPHVATDDVEADDKPSETGSAELLAFRLGTAPATPAAMPVGAAARTTTPPRIARPRPAILVTTVSELVSRRWYPLRLMSSLCKIGGAHYTRSSSASTTLLDAIA